MVFRPNSGLNAFIGENSVGKSNIFDGINWLIGSTWPSFSSTQTEDHWNGDINNKIKITLEYDDEFVLTLDESLDKYQFSITKDGSFGNNTDRSNHSSAYLGIDREIKDYLPSNRWSLIGRILQQINSQFEKEDIVVNDENGERVTKSKKDVLRSSLEKIRDKILFSVGRSEGNRQKGTMDQFIEILQKESAKQLNREESSFSIDLSLYDPWNFYRTLQLLVKENDMDIQFQASNLGMGVQASITIAILKAYAELNLPNKAPIFIDEPELFLHPQAQRNFYNILREMTQDIIDENGTTIKEGLQIFYTTHSPNFLRTDKFDEIFLIRKNKEKGTFQKAASITSFVTDLKIRKNIESTPDEMYLYFKNVYENTGDSQKANEGFFAKKIILVEGQSESLILPYFFELVGFDYIKEGISIVRCGCKNEIDRFFRLYNEFGIPCYLLFDGDKQNEGTDDEDNTKNENGAILELFGIADKKWLDGSINDRFLGFETKLEDNLNFSVIGNNKSVRLFQQVKQNIITKEDLPSWVSGIVEKIKNLKEPLESVLKTSSEEDPFR